MAELQRAGKIRLIGVSNFSPAQIEAFGKVAPVQTVQPPYNLFERAIEEDVLPYCRNKNIDTLAYGSLCRGLLSGRMTAQTKFDGDDLRKVDPKFRAPRFEQYLRAVERLDRFAQANYGRRVIHLALRWVLDRQDSTIALWGARQARPTRPDLEPLGLAYRRVRHGRDRSHRFRNDRGCRGSGIHGPACSARRLSRPERASMEGEMVDEVTLRTKDVGKERCHAR